MTTKNPAKDALGQWRAVPEKLPRTWHEKVTPYARFIGLELYRRCDDAYQGIVQVGSPWMDDVCRQLEIDGTHRKALKKALATLVAKGLIKVFDGYLFVDFGQRGETADRARVEPNSNLTQTRHQLGRNQKQTDVTETVEVTSDRVGKDKGREGRKEAEHAVPGPALFVESRIAAVLAPPSPATLTAEPALNRFIRIQYVERFLHKWGSLTQEPPAAKVDQVAKLVTAAANAQGVPVEELAGRTLDALFASKNQKVIEYKHALGCVISRPAEFMGRLRAADVESLDPSLQDKRSEIRSPILDKLAKAAAGGQR